MRDFRLSLARGTTFSEFMGFKVCLFFCNLFFKELGYFIRGHSSQLRILKRMEVQFDFQTCNMLKTNTRLKRFIF